MLLAGSSTTCAGASVLAGTKISTTSLGPAAAGTPDRGAPPHPLQPGLLYPEPGSGLFTYAADWLPALSPERGRQLPERRSAAAPEWGRGAGLELAELLRFYRQPARYFLNRRLKVWFELEEATIEDSEPFELDGLQHYQLKRCCWMPI